MSDNLFREFDNTTDDQWLNKIKEDLRGKSAGEIAKRRPLEGLNLKVFYSKNDAPNSLQLNVSADWHIIAAESYYEATMADPIGHLIATGNTVLDYSDDMEVFASVFKRESEEKHIGVNATLYQAAGASASFELACTISHLNEYYHDLALHKILPEDVLNKVSVKVGIGPDYFLEIAKLRALRILVSNLTSIYKSKNLPFQIYAEIGMMNFSSADADTNILRSTTAGMSAVIGNCDHLIIPAHDVFLEKNHQFGDRIARNIQLLMKHEAHLDKVTDPGSGSYYIESLTKSLAESAWKIFKDIEIKGGFKEAFKSGYIQSEIEKTAGLRKEAVKNTDNVLIGVNKYLKEDPIKITRSGEPIKGEYPALIPIYLEDSAK